MIPKSLPALRSLGFAFILRELQENEDFGLVGAHGRLVFCKFIRDIYFAFFVVLGGSEEANTFQNLFSGYFDPSPPLVI